MFNIPGGNAFTRIGKFGKMYPFSHDYGEGLFDTTNHNMPSYIEAINTHEVEYTEQKIRKWFHGIISCPVDVKIMKGSECVGEIVNDHVTSLTDSEVILYVAGEDKVFFVPDQDHYSIRITATDDGEMEYTIEGLGKDGMRCISDIQLTKGKEMVCELNSKTSVVDTKLYTLDKDGRKSKEIKDDGTEVMVPDFPLVIGIIFLIGFVIYFIYQYLRGSHPTKVAGSK